MMARCHTLILLGSFAIAGCGSEATAPAPEPGFRLASHTEYLTERGGIPTIKQRGTYEYDAAGRLARFDFERIDEYPDPDRPFVLRTFYSLQHYDGDLPAGGEVFVRKGEEFVKSREWALTLDAAGRVSRRTTTYLLAIDFSPIHEVTVEQYAYDDAGRLVEVVQENGERWVLEYDEEGNVSREALHTSEGNVIVFEHSYDDGKNPFFDLARRQGGLDGLIVVVAPWALFHSPRNVIRTETRVLGREGVVSVRTVEIEAYGEHGYPLRSLQELRNTGNPDGNLFGAEFEYESF